MTKISPSQSDIVSAMTIMIDQCEKYLELPQKDEAIKQARIRQDSAIGQATYKASQERNQISSIMSTMRTFELTITNALSDRGAKLPDIPRIDTVPSVTMSELESRRVKSTQLRDSILESLRDIDEIVRFYGTVRTVGYILLGVIFLVAVFVLTGVVNLNA